MSSNMDKIRSYLESGNKQENVKSSEDILEDLYINCFMCMALNSEQVNEKYKNLYEKTRHLPIRQEEAILDAVNDACVAVERIAFCEGVRLGFQLVMDLLKP